MIWCAEREARLVCGSAGERLSVGVVSHLSTRAVHCSVSELREREK